MNREQTQQLLMVMQAAYPNYRPQDKTVTINLWHSTLGGYDYQVVMAALQTYIVSDTSGFAPAIGQIIDKIQDLTEQEYPTEMEAWAMYHKAICRASHSQEEFDKLPEIVQKTVGDAYNIYSAGMSTSFNEDIARSNFLKSYRITCERERQKAKMPRGLIDATANKLIG